MTWIKLDDKAPRHPKVASLTDRAFRWWVKGLCYASEFLTNGVLHPIFWKQVPKQSRAELTGNHLWDWRDPNFEIHDYLAHQSSREDVEADKQRNREKVAAFRERRKTERRNQPVTGNTAPSVTGNVTDPCNRLVTDPENREQRTDTEIREERQTAAPLVMSPMAYEKRKQQCAFVGSRLEIPHGLHADLRKMLGGVDPDAALQAWYLALNDEIDQSGEAIAPDVFKWLKARFTGWVQSKIRTDNDAKQLARLEAIEKGARPWQV